MRNIQSLAAATETGQHWNERRMNRYRELSNGKWNVFGAVSKLSFAFLLLDTRVLLFIYTAVLCTYIHTNTRAHTEM